MQTRGLPYSGARRVTILRVVPRIEGRIDAPDVNYLAKLAPRQDPIVDAAAHVTVAAQQHVKRHIQGWEDPQEYADDDGDHGKLASAECDI